MLLDDDLKGSEVRLWRLIEARLNKGSDAAAIDQRIWDLFGEELAVMFTDLSGFSRMVEAFGIIHFLQIIYEQKQVLLPIVEAHDGILIKVEADSFLIIFKRPEGALRCAVAMQHACTNLNARRVPEEQVLLCVGLGFGRVLRIGDQDVFGAEVNAASKLGEDTAKAGQIFVTRAMRDAVEALDLVEFDEKPLRLTGFAEAYRTIYPAAEESMSLADGLTHA